MSRRRRRSDEGEDASDDAETDSEDSDCELVQDVAIAIDAGTTNWVVAYFDPESSSVRLVPNQMGSHMTPSYVSYGEHGRVMGETAREQASCNPSSTLFNIKRLLGRKLSDPEIQSDLAKWPFHVVDRGGYPVYVVQAEERDGSESGTKEVRPIEAWTALMTTARTCAQEMLGRQYRVRWAVITVPAYFSDEQREVTRDAGQAAGLEVLRIINEPTAAAIAFGWSKPESWRSKDRRLLVFDLGGGTFDVSLVSIKKGSKTYDVLSTEGDAHLGGVDFTEAIVDHCVSEIKRSVHALDLRLAVHRPTLMTLQKTCEDAKRALSMSTHATISVSLPLAGGQTWTHELSRTQLSSLTENEIATCIRLTDLCMKAGYDKVNKVTTSACAWLTADVKMVKAMKMVDEVLLMGGSSRMCSLQEELSDYFGGKELNKTVNCDEGVAIGAAVMSAVLKPRDPSEALSSKLRELLLHDVLPKSLGVGIKGGRMSVILPRNSSTPVTLEEPYQTVEDGQLSIWIPVYEGEGVVTSENVKLGEFTLKAEAAPAGEWKFSVSFEVDASGTLTVTARRAGKALMEKITLKNTTRMTTDDIALLHSSEQVYALRAKDQLASKVELDKLEKCVKALQRLETSLEADHADKLRVGEAVKEATAWIDVNRNMDAEEIADKLREMKALGQSVQRAKRQRQEGEDVVVIEEKVKVERE